jgi:hypothetical protein
VDEKKIFVITIYLSYPGLGKSFYPVDAINHPQRIYLYLEFSSCCKTLFPEKTLLH